MSRILAASLVAVVFSAALFIYSIVDPGPYGATDLSAGNTGSVGTVAVPQRRSTAASTARPMTVPRIDAASEDDGAAAGLGLHVSSIEELLSFYDTIDYGNDAWRQPEKGVPAIFVTGLPEPWVASLNSGARKTLFFRAILPLVLHVNREILDDRRVLLAYLENRANGIVGDRDTLYRIAAIAAAYGIVEAPDKGKPFLTQLTGAQLKELVRRVDTIPVSLALGQAAYESGYAPSRLATGDNALFGAWRDGDGMRTPRRGDPAGSRYATPLDSTRAYAHNLNTHPVYAEFRNARAAMRREAAVLDGHALAASLVVYSNSAVTYTNTLRALISENRLTDLDGARLRGDDAVRVVAVTSR